MKRASYDIAVIGGGPAGMMAAGQAAQRGAHVVLIEKNRMPGAKLLITGKGRCNITKAEYDVRRFIEPFGGKGKFLYPVLHAFGTEDTVRFFNTRGLPTRVERGNRVFPAVGRSADVLRVLSDFLLETKVHVMTGAAAKGLERRGKIIQKLLLSNREITAERYVVCTGGLSYPSTGSTGEGLKWIEGVGHTVTPLGPGLVPVILKEPWIRELEGLTLKNVRIAVYQNGRKMDERFGEASFTGRGMDGPIILDMSKNIGSLLKDPVHLHIDLKPALEFDVLDARVRRDLRENNNKAFKNSLDKLLPKQIIPVIVRLSGIPPLKKANSLTREERQRLVRLLKQLKVHVEGLEGFGEAIITTGGVALNEIDPKTMRSKLIENLYFAGEILDLDGPTGGYNLQVCWSTGYVAGQAAACLVERKTRDTSPSS